MKISEKNCTQVGISTGDQYPDCNRRCRNMKISEKKMYPGGDFNRGPISRLQSSLCLPSATPPPSSVTILFIYQTRIGYIRLQSLLCLPSATPPPPSVAILFIYQTRIGYIWIHNIRELYEFTGHRRYEFILFNVWIHILRLNVWGAAISLAHIIIAPTN